MLEACNANDDLNGIAPRTERALTDASSFLSV